MQVNNKQVSEYVLCTAWKCIRREDRLFNYELDAYFVVNSAYSFIRKQESQAILAVLQFTCILLLDGT